MQLKSLAKKTEALNSITSVLNTTYNTKKEYEEALAVVGKSYTTEILKAAIAESKLNEQQIKTILSANGLQGELLETTANELANAASTNAVAASQAGTTATTIGLGTAFEGLWISITKATKALVSFLFKSPAGWATLIIGAFAGAAFAVKTYNDSIEKAKEKAKERTSELFDEFKEMNKTLADHKKTVAELADRYDELSKGVNLSTNENRTLSTKEYEEFLDINEQLADTFPELTKGIDKNGRSILTLGTNGIAAKEQLEELLKAEEDLNNFRIAQDLEETFKGVYTYLKEADNATNTLNDSLDSVNETIDELRKKSENGIDLKNTEIVRFGYNYNGHYAENKNLIYSGDYGNKTDLAYMNALKTSAEDFFNTLSDERKAALNGKYSLNSKNLFDIQTNSRDGTFEVYSKLFALDDDEIESLQGIIEDNISLLIGEFKDEVGSLSKELEKAVQEGESAWRDFIPSLVAGMKSYSAFKDLQDPDLQDIAVKIVEGLDSSYGTAMKEYNPDPYVYIRDKLLVPMSKLDEADKKKVKDAFTELMTLDANDISDKNIKQINDLTKEITDILGEDFDIKVALGFDGDDVKTRLQESIRQIAENDEQVVELTRYTENFTKEQAEFWLETTRGIKGATSATYKYEKKLEDAKKAAKSIPLSISETVEQIDTRLRSAFSSLQSAYQEIFTIDEDTGKKIFTHLDETEITDKFKPLLDTLQELDGIKGIHVDYSIYEDFVSVLVDTSSTADEVHEQFNKLATDIIYTSNCTNISAETFNLLAESLSEMGVTNAYEVLEKIRDAQEELAKQGYDFTTITQDEAESIIKLGSVSKETEESLKGYLIQRNLAHNPLDTSEDIENLEELCNSLGITGEMYEAVNVLKAAFEEKQRGSYDYDIDNTIEYYQKKIKDLASGYGYDFNFYFDGAISKDKSKYESSSKDTTETLDWIEQAIENVEKEIEKLDEIANSSYSTFSEKNEALAKEISKVSEEINLQQQAYDEYMRKAESIALPEKYKQLVQNGAINIEDISDKNLQNLISEYQKWYDKAQDVSDKIKDLKTDIKDLHVDAYELQKDNLKDRLDSDSITEKQYLEGLKDAYEKFYADLEDFAEQYHEAVLEYLEEEKNYLNSVANAATSLIDTEIDKIQEDADSQEKIIQKQIDLLESKKKPLQDELDALEDKAKKEDLILNLQKAQYELARAENQRTKLIYKDGQMVYTSDPESIRDAKKDVDDAKLEIQKQSIQDQIDALNDEIDRYNDLIDQINNAADIQIEALEKIKNKWQEVIDQQEYAKNVLLFIEEFGTDAITRILTGNDDDLLEQWKNSYITTLANLDMESQGYIGNVTEQIAELYGVNLSPLQEQFRNVNGSITDLGVASNETIPNVASNIEEISKTAINAASEVSHVTDAINDIPESKDVTISIHTVEVGKSNAIALKTQHEVYSGKAYADGTRHAEKGLAVVGEEKPEVVITNDKKALLAEQPTLLNMEGGETVFDGDETEKMLKARGLRRITPDELPLLKALTQYNSSEITQRFTPNITSPANAILSSTMQNASHAVTNNSAIQPSYTMGDVHIHCPGITKDEVVKQIGTELTNVFNGMSLKAYQRANITR